MSEHDYPQKPVADQVKETVQNVSEKVQPKVAELKEKLNTEDQVVAFCKTNALQLVTTVAVVGILLNNRKSFKYMKNVYKNHDANVQGAQQAIKALKAAGQQFTFYPGVGVYVD